MKLLFSTLLLAIAHLPRTSGERKPTLLYQYDTPTWIENFAVRRNGQILPARATSAILTQLDLQRGTQETIADETKVGSAIMGITEVFPDLYAMNTMYCDLSKLSCTAGTGITWSVDLRHHHAQVRKLVEGPTNKTILNGMVWELPQPKLQEVVSN
jgi:hypothetical protein